MSFDPFGDFETRGYLRNVFAEKDPATVKRQEHHAFRGRIGEALGALQRRPTLGYDDVRETHHRLFRDYYPWAGQDRLALLPDQAVGRGGRFELFAHPRDIGRAAEHALARAAGPEDMRKHPGEVFGLLAYAHPFLDGNGRSLMTVHAELSRRAGIHIVWQHIEKGDFLRALTGELERPGQILDGFLAPHVRDGALPLEAAAAGLRDHPGLGPTGPGSSGGGRSLAGSLLERLAARQPVDERPPTPIARRQAGPSLMQPAVEEGRAATQNEDRPRPGRDPSP